MRLGSVRFVRLIFIDCLPYAAVFLIWIVMDGRTFLDESVQNGSAI